MSHSDEVPVWRRLQAPVSLISARISLQVFQFSFITNVSSYNISVRRSSKFFTADFWTRPETHAVIRNKDAHTNPQAAILPVSL